MPWWKKEDPKEPDKKPDPEPPKYVTKEELDSFKTSLQDTIVSTLTQRTDPPPRHDPPPKEPEPIDDVSDADYQAALDNLQNPDFEGDRRAQLRVVQKRESASRERLKRDIFSEMDRRLSSQQSTLHQVNEEITRNSLNSLRYYKLFKKEIDEAIAKVPPEQRTTQIAQLVHNQIVAMHQDQVIEHEIKERERIAKEKQPLDTDTPNRRQRSQTQKPTFVEVFGENLADPNARMHGAPLWDQHSRGHRDPEDYARSIGFESADEYAEYATNILAIEPCPKCFAEIVQGKCNCELIAKYQGRAIRELDLRK